MLNSLAWVLSVLRGGQWSSFVLTCTCRKEQHTLFCCLIETLESLTVDSSKSGVVEFSTLLKGIF